MYVETKNKTPGRQALVISHGTHREDLTPFFLQKKETSSTSSRNLTISALAVSSSCISTLRVSPSCSARAVSSLMVAFCAQCTVLSVSTTRQRQPVFVGSLQVRWTSHQDPSTRKDQHSPRKDLGVHFSATFVVCSHSILQLDGNILHLRTQREQCLLRILQLATATEQVLLNRKRTRGRSLQVTIALRGIAPASEIHLGCERFVPAYAGYWCAGGCCTLAGGVQSPPGASAVRQPAAACTS